jgi:hypothetical protein
MKELVKLLESFKNKIDKEISNLETSAPVCKGKGIGCAEIPADSPEKIVRVRSHYRRKARKNLIKYRIIKLGKNDYGR